MATNEATRLLSWFEANARTMPWRGSSDPYAILVCEVMSQQTRIETVVDYWTRWMRTFPDIPTLADADVDEVMRHWAGLGYYRRARNLHACAIEVADRFGGELPETFDELLQLPGIGPYTAAAIGSIVHGEPVLALDGNVARVSARIGGIYGDPTKAAFRRSVQAVGRSLMDDARAGDSNEALMELGATVCTPRSPDCDRCPLPDVCHAFALDDPTVLPEPKPRKAPRRQTRTCVVLINGGHVWMRKGKDELLGGLFEFPEIDDLELSTDDLASCGQIEHIFSHIRMTYHVWRAAIGRDAAPQGGEWMAVEDVEKAALSTAMRKVFAAAQAADSAE